MANNSLTLACCWTVSVKLGQGFFMFWLNTTRSSCHRSQSLCKPSFNTEKLLFDKVQTDKVAANPPKITGWKFKANRAGFCHSCHGDFPPDFKCSILSIFNSHLGAVIQAAALVYNTLLLIHHTKWLVRAYSVSQKYHYLKVCWFKLQAFYYFPTLQMIQQKISLSKTTLTLRNI